MNIEKSQKNTGVFDWTDKTKLRPSQKVVLNYTGGLEIHFKENVQKTFSKNGYLLAGPFSQEKGGEAHLRINGQQYYISKIYVLAKEVVIQHEPFTNGSPVSLRIPIVSADPKNRSYTCIDRLLSGTPIVSFQLNNLLNEGDTAAFYAGGTVLYLKTGISIQTTPAKNAVNPFDEMGISLFEPDYTLVSVHLADSSAEKKEGLSKMPHTSTVAVADPSMKEGMEDMMEMDDDMECTPFDIGADNVQFMQVPIADEIVSGQSDKNTMYGILYMFYMGIIIMVLAFLVPMMVPIALSKIMKGEPNSTKMNNFKSLFVLFFTCIFIASVFITLDGSERHNVAESKAGLIIFFLAFACCSIFVVVAVTSGVLTTNTGEVWDIGKVMEFIIECLPFKKFHKVSTYSAMVFLLFCAIVAFDKYVMHGNFSFSSYTMTWGIFLSITIGLLVCLVTGRINLGENIGNNPNYSKTTA